MDALAQSVKKTRITERDLHGLTPADLLSLRTATSFSTITTGASKWFAEHTHIPLGTFTAEEQRIILTRHGELESGKVLTVGRFEEGSWPNQASVTYTAKHVSVVKVDGSVTSYTAGPVPIVNPRLGAARVAVFFCSLWHLKGGNLEEIITYQEMYKRFMGPDAAIDVRDIARVKEIFISTMIKFPAYLSAIRAYKTVQGNDFLDMVIGSIQSCPWGDFFALHDVVCTRFIRIFNIRETATSTGSTTTLIDRQAFVDGKGELKPIVDDKSFLLLTRKWVDERLINDAHRAAIDFRAVIGHFPVLLTGPVHTKHLFPPVRDDFKGAYACYATGNTIRGSYKSGMGTFLQSAGFSSMSSNLHNYMCLLVAMTVNAWKCGYNFVCVSTGSGQLGVIESSLKYYAKTNSDYRWCYVLDGSERTSVPVTLQDRVENVCPQTAHLVKIFAALPESVSMDKDPSPKFLDAATTIRRTLVGVAGYTIFATICHDVFWNITKDAFSKKVTNGNVFQFRAPFDMRGIYSTCYTMRFADEEQSAQILSAEEWCKRICACNANANLYFLKPVPFHSSISNMLRPEFKNLGMFSGENEGWGYAAVSDDHSVWGQVKQVPITMPVAEETEEELSYYDQMRFNKEYTNNIVTLAMSTPSIETEKGKQTSLQSLNPPPSSSNNKQVAQEKKVFKEDKEKTYHPHPKKKNEESKYKKKQDAPKFVPKLPPVKYDDDDDAPKGMSLPPPVTVISGGGDLSGGSADNTEGEFYG